MAENTDAFDEIMEKVGFEGRFQRIFSWLFVSTMTFCGSMMFMNLILALNVPDHWCNVPGRNKTNFTLEEWRNITLPMEADNRGEIKFSTCKMYNVNFSQIQDWEYQNYTFSTFETVDCTHGYEYDRQWYERTIVTDEDWVCEKDLYVTNTFVVSRIAEVIGTFVFGQLGDTIGRRAIFYCSVAICLLGKSVSFLTTSNFTIFFIATAVSSLTISVLFQSPIVIAMEISKEDKRSNIAMAQSLGWSFGTSFMPLIYWWLRDWVPYIWLTTLPTAMGLICYKYMIESPRWLISRRRFGDAIIQFRKMAKINGRTFDISEKELAEKYIKIKEEKVFGIMSLFSGWRLARNTAIISFCWCVVAVSYFTLVLFSSRMGGNPFLNFLLQSIVEVPSYFVGKYLGDTVGRRLAISLSFLVAAIACIFIVFLATDPSYELLVVCIATLIKFFNGVTFFVGGLQEMEIFPTCLRQTGIALGTITANAVGSLAPYFVYLGTNYDIRYPYFILTILFFMGAAATTILPETLHQKLPDSLEEAKIFGKNQKFWSLPKSPKLQENDDDSETTRMNQEKYEI